MPVSLMLSYERTARLLTRAVVTFADVAMVMPVLLVCVRWTNLPSMHAPFVLGVFARNMPVLVPRTVSVLDRCTRFFQVYVLRMTCVFRCTILSVCGSRLVGGLFVVCCVWRRLV